MRSLFLFSLFVFFSVTAFGQIDKYKKAKPLQSVDFIKTTTKATCSCWKIVSWQQSPTYTPINNQPNLVATSCGKSYRDWLWVKVFTPGNTGPNYWVLVNKTDPYIAIDNDLSDFEPLLLLDRAAQGNSAPQLRTDAIPGKPNSLPTQYKCPCPSSNGCAVKVDTGRDKYGS